MDLNGGIADMLEASIGGGHGGRVVRVHCFGYLDMPNVRNPISGSFTILSTRPSRAPRWMLRGTPACVTTIRCRGRGPSEHRLGVSGDNAEVGIPITNRVGRTLRGLKDLKTFSRSPSIGGLNFEGNFDYSYEGVMRAPEQALRRPALDTVDALDPRPRRHLPR
jgi:hypothetical protein